MEENIRECLSKLIQLRFYWLSCHTTRAIFLKILDDSGPTIFQGKKYAFSKEDPMPEYPIGWFANIYVKNPVQDKRESYMTFLRKTIILESWTEIEESFTNKGIKIKDLNLSNDDDTAFEFLRQSRICLFHWNGLKKKKGKSITWNNITIDNSEKPLKIKDSEIDLLLKTIIKTLIKKLPDEKIVNHDLRMAIDIDSVQKIAKKRFKDYDEIIQLYFG